MANVRIPGLVAKTNKAGVTSYYWQPSKTLREAKWEPIALGKDEGEAIAAARARNQDVERWKAGGQAALSIAPRQLQGTLAYWIGRYRKEWVEGTRPDGRRLIAASTAETYKAPLARLEAWAGKHPIAYITRARVRVLRDKLLATMGEYPAHTTLKLGRQVFKFIADHDGIGREANPFLEFGLSAPAPRDVIWSAPAREAIVAAAIGAGHQGIALAAQLGFAIGQREQDILSLAHSQFVAIPEHKMQPEDYRALAALADDKTPRGIRVRQHKTKAWIEVPVVGEVRRAIEASIERGRARDQLAIILDDSRERTYGDSNGQTRFQRDFADVREAAAVAAGKGGDEELAAEIRTLQFRDLRRTCVVYLGELGLDVHLIAAITGHDLDETMRILKTYMPRTTGRAARAIALATAREAKEASRENEEKKA